MVKQKGRPSLKGDVQKLWLQSRIAHLWTQEKEKYLFSMQPYEIPDKCVLVRPNDE
jgi:hypothetical protein